MAAGYATQTAIRWRPARPQRRTNPLVVVKSDTASAQAIGFDPAKALRKLQSLSRHKR
jgi:hypothetical protein